MHKVVTDLDTYLKDNFLGSYDIVKYYFQCVEKGIISGKNVGDHSRELRKLMGSLGMRIVNSNYFSEKAISFLVDKIIENPRLFEEINKNSK